MQAFDRHDGDVPYYSWSGAPEGVQAVFSTRHGGVSTGHHASLNVGANTADDPAAIAQNRRVFSAAVGVDASLVRTVWQVHGTTVARIHDLDDEDMPVLGWDDDLHPFDGDGLVSLGSHPMAVCVADCAGVVIAGEIGLAVVHAGWRGVVAGILENAIEPLTGTVRAAIGPAIGPCCFEVSQEVADQFSPANVLDNGGRPHVNLAAEVRYRLLAAGVAQVDVLDACTKCTPEHYSYRGDGGTTGRQCVLAWRD